MEPNSSATQPEEALALAIRDGVADRVDDVEVIVSRGDRTSYAIENDLVVPALECDTWSVAMRALRNGRLATAATTSRDPADSISALVRALNAAQPEQLSDFAAPDARRNDTRNCDAALWSLVDAPAEVRRMAVAIREGARAVRPGAEVVVEADLTVARARRAFVTKRGGPVTSASTMLSSFVMVDGNDWDAWAGTARPDDAAVTELGRTLVSSLPTREVTCEEFLGGPKELTVVLHPRLFESLLRTLFLERVAADRVLAGISPAKEGDVVANTAFDLFDDPGAVGSLRGQACDDEGISGARKAIVSKGVLSVMPCDRRSAQLRKTAPTGNGYRIPILAEDRSEAPVRVGFTHLEVSPGTTPRDALVKGRTVLITDLLGLHSSNKATGAFNNPIQGGLALEDGVAVARVKPGQWSATGNLHALLKRFEALSAERMMTGGALLPWVAARVQVA